MNEKDHDFYIVAGIGSTPPRWLMGLAYVGKTSSCHEERKETTGEKDREVLVCQLMVEELNSIILYFFAPK